MVTTNRPDSELGNLDWRKRNSQNTRANIIIYLATWHTQPKCFADREPFLLFFTDWLELSLWIEKSRALRTRKLQRKARKQPNPRQDSKPPTIRKNPKLEFTNRTMAYVDHAFSISDEDIMMETSYTVNNRPPIKEIVLAVSLLVFGTFGIICGTIMAYNRVGGDRAHGTYLITFWLILS